MSGKTKTADVKRDCFCANNSVFVGSSLSSFSTSFSWFCVSLIVQLTDSSALFSFVVSPPISTVMPAILLAMFHLLSALGYEKSSQLLDCFE